jgi:hypothetical protein
MLSAHVAVQEILAGGGDHAAIWNVNIDDDYHEEASSSSSPGEGAAKSGTYAPAAQTA